MRLSTSLRRASTTAMMPIGRLIRNTSRQLEAAASTPPNDGPKPDADAATADSSATAYERRSGGNTFSTRPTAAGTRQAAPSA